jgi:hypothetical protein
MARYLRIIIPASLLVVLLASSALANRAAQPAATNQVEADEPDEGGPPSQQVLDKVVDRLADAGIETNTDAVAELADSYGVGGAARVLAWADATGMDPAEIAALRDSGLGWGEIARQLNEEDLEGDLELRPGIGWVMGGGQGQGHGRENAPGQAKKQE